MGTRVGRMKTSRRWLFQLISPQLCWPFLYGSSAPTRDHAAADQTASQRDAFMDTPPAQGAAPVWGGCCLLLCPHSQGPLGYPRKQTFNRNRPGGGASVHEASVQLMVKAASRPADQHSQHNHTRAHVCVFIFMKFMTTRRQQSSVSQSINQSI